MHNFKPYKKVKVNGQSRTIYIKSSSKSQNPIMYIKHKKEMITYKQFLKLKKMRGGGFNLNETILSSTDVTDYTFEQMKNFINRYPLPNENGVYHIFYLTTSDNKTYQRTYNNFVSEPLEFYKNINNNTMKDFHNEIKSTGNSTISNVFYVVIKSKSN